MNDVSVRLIAHRGGVVNRDSPENSLQALRGAVDHGYWRVEVDIRATADGVPVVYHGPPGDRLGSVIEAETWERLEHAWEGPRQDPWENPAQPGPDRSSHASGPRPRTLEEYLPHLSDEIGLMLDCKTERPPEAFRARLRDVLEPVRPLESIMFIGSRANKARFEGTAWTSVNPRFLPDRHAMHEAASRRQFLFARAISLRSETVAQAFDAGMAVVPSVNLFHYVERNREPKEGGRADIRRLLADGVRDFQIDSAYEDAFSGCRWTRYTDSPDPGAGAGGRKE